MVNLSTKVIFRADGNGKIGYGHLSRLNAFAEIIREVFEFVFIISDRSDSSLINKNFKFIKIPSKIVLSDELRWIHSQFNPKTHIIIADGYQFNSSYQKQIKELEYKLIFIDDLVKFHMHADCVINHAIGVMENQYSGNKYVRYFLGSEYALLRKSFIEASKSREKKELKFETAFISFGGTDPSNILRKAINSLLRFKTFRKIYVVVGKSFKDSDTIRFLKENIRTELFTDIEEKEMFKIMKKSDFAIVPSSTVSYELASSRCTIVSGYTTKNQFSMYEGLRTKNIIFELGDISNFKEKDFNFQLEKIMTSKIEVFERKIQNQIKYFDGYQKERLIEIINSLL